MTTSIHTSLLGLSKVGTALREPASWRWFIRIIFTIFLIIFETFSYGDGKNEFGPNTPYITYFWLYPMGDKPCVTNNLIRNRVKKCKLHKLTNKFNFSWNICCWVCLEFHCDGGIVAFLQKLSIKRFARGMNQLLTSTVNLDVISFAVSLFVKKESNPRLPWNVSNSPGSAICLSCVEFYIPMIDHAVLKINSPLAAVENILPSASKSCEKTRLTPDVEWYHTR